MAASIGDITYDRFVPPSLENELRAEAVTANRIVVVGAGDCGTRAVLRLRETGFTGDIALVGDELEAPYERPTLSKEVLISDVGTPTPIATEDQLRAATISWHRGVRANAINLEQHTLALSDGTTLAYDHLLLATGARPRRPAVPGVSELGKEIHLVRSFRDVVALRHRLSPGTRVLVIGGGFIGLEVAASAVARHCKVTIAEFAYRLMSRVVPAAVAQTVHDRHVANGVDVRCGAGLERLSMRGGSLLARLTDDSVVEADVLVAGVGAIPNTDLASAAGLRVRNGIEVDGHLRTSDPHVFAAGDCCSVPLPLYGNRRFRLESWRGALGQAHVAAANLLGSDEAYNEVPWFWTDQYDLQVQVAGLHAEASREVARNTTDGPAIGFGLDETGRVVSACGVANSIAVARDLQTARRMIGARLYPRPADLADPSIDLRSLLDALVVSAGSSVGESV